MFVYVLSAEINNKKSYKIGYTRRQVEDRIREFKTGNASDFIVVYKFESNWSSKIEAILHRKFSDKKINGEWFDLTSDDLIEIYKCCNLHHKNFEALLNNTWVIDRGFKL